MTSAATDTPATENWQRAISGLESNTNMGEATMVVVQTTPEAYRWTTALMPRRGDSIGAARLAVADSVAGHHVESYGSQA